MAHRALRSSLRTRLFATIVLIVVLSVAVTGALGFVLTRRAVEHANIDDLSHQDDLLAERERAALVPLGHLGSLRPFLARQGEQVQVVDLSRPSPYLPDAGRSAVRAGGAAQGTVTVDGSRLLYAARNVSGRGFVLLRPAVLRSWPWLQGLLFAGLVGAGLAALASFLSARAIARPVRRVAVASESLADGRSPTPLPEEGSRELSALARAFNEMAERLARARETERTFLLSVSHELKTPLTAIRGYAEGLADGAVPVDEAAATIRREADRLERLVGDLLELARLNRSGFAVERQPLDLAVVAREAVGRFEAEAGGGGVTLTAPDKGVAPALGDHDRVLQIVSNLVENALRSTPPGGSVTVRSAPGLISVEDTGLGLPAEDLAHAFERFYLYDRHGGQRRLGTGLGLAIVKELADAMGGSVEVRSEVGRGTAFSVRLPEAAQAIATRDAASARA